VLSFLKNTIYIQLTSERLSVLQVETGYIFSESPWLAMTKESKGRWKGEWKIIGYGTQALTMTNNPSVKVVNGFKHPRTIIADFNVAQKTIAHCVQQVLKHRAFRPSPIIVIHLMEEWEGGLTQIEVRALTELCMMSGARMAFCWQGSELSIEELRTLKFPATKGKLLT
jgi:rod shape-determining protein MreB